MKEHMKSFLTIGGSPGDVGKVGEATEGLENEQSPFHRFSYVTPQMSRVPSVASATSQALHLHHLASCPCFSTSVLGEHVNEKSLLLCV